MCTFYFKGSSECMKELSTSASIPTDYDAVSAKYAQEGCYVLALAHRDIKTMSRDDLEAGCHFIGFVLFRNMIKDDTTDAIGQLKRGGVRPVMITGDTDLTDYDFRF
ncbi:hypothetical protein BD408DRAFT_409499 [Parasitella parasitica]|nr:hypothetical protein BD408DRAFT_409499 [Parasitella parasitica]